MRSGGVRMEGNEREGKGWDESGRDGKVREGK